VFRIGQGIDIHQFDVKRPLFLGGVKISDSDGLIGHSDADVLLHAVMDALLGAVGKGDIGELFPDNDPKFLGADSKDLLKSVWNKLLAEGWQLVNLDCTVLAERPKISPYKHAMQVILSEIFGVDESCCNIKATTSEKMGFIGRAEGMMALAVVLLQR